MIIIDKSYFSDKQEYSWLEQKLDSSFALTIGDVSKIVFGFNGVGKSSITNCLRTHNDTNHYMFLDYETDSQKYSGSSIRISPYIYDIERISREVSSKEDDIGFIALAKNQGYTKTLASKGPSFLKKFCKNSPTGKSPAVTKVSDEKYKAFITRYMSASPQFFFKLVKDLELVSTSIAEIENYQKDKWRELLTSIKDHIVKPDTCPVCDTTKLDIYGIVDKKINDLSLRKSVLVKTMEENGMPCDKDTIDLYLGLYNALSSDLDLLNDYIICGNSELKHQEISQTNSEIRKKKVDLSSLLSKRTEKYNQIKANKDRFINDVSKYLGIDASSILFDDNNCVIEISLDRDALTYSTGERHILWFLVEIYSFLGSDCTTLILDDPASSLDLSNLYKIAFEIVRNSALSNKTLVVFTHSCELINAINSQYRDKLDVYYLEEYKMRLFCDEIPYKHRHIANVIDTEHFACMSPNIYKSLKERDFVGHSSPEHKVYHYSPDESQSVIDPCNLSNHILHRLIDSYRGIIKIDFYADSFKKVLLIVALRVWLEKALYDLIPASDTNRKSDFLSEDMLQQKIGIVANSSGRYASDLLSDNNIDKGIIMSKKVMLNQNSHYYSQVMPFAYAINISLDDIDREIKEIKSLFGY